MLVLVLFGAVACGSGEPKGMALTEDTELSAKIAEVQKSGAATKLRDLTGGDWDRVRVFPEPVSREFVERELRTEVDMGEFFGERGHILAFSREGAVQRVVYTTPNNLLDGTYGPGVTLTSPQPGAARLLLQDTEP